MNENLESGIVTAVTLKDVAKYAKVSVRTVSNVVNGYAHVSDTMRHRVQNAIDHLGYQPNLAARNLRGGRTGMLALVIPEIDSPYFSELARHTINAAEERDYHVMIDQVGHDQLRALDILRGSHRGVRFDGVLFGSVVTQIEFQRLSPQSIIPTVFIGENQFDGRFDHIAIDSFQTGFDATQHLVSLGCEHIAAIGVQPLEEYRTPHRKTAGYQAALTEARLPVRSDYVMSAARYDRRSGYDAALSLLNRDNKPDAIFCFSDLLAIGATRAVLDAGFRVPADVAIVGVDNIEEGRFMRPSLSTISLDRDLVAHLAMGRLLKRMADPASPAEEVVAPHNLIIRESTAPGSETAESRAGRQPQR